MSVLVKHVKTKNYVSLKIYSCNKPFVTHRHYDLSYSYYNFKVRLYHIRNFTMTNMVSSSLASFS